MKKIGFIPIALIFFSIVSCSPDIQVFETKNTSPLTVEKSNYTFENDTLKIVYVFWASRGTLAFTVFNKLSVPLYIDWKKSSYVKNSEKLDYWIDMSTTKGTSKGRSTFYYGDAYGSSYNNSTTVKPQQIIFIAPKSSIKKDQFILFPSPASNTWPWNTVKEERTDKPGKKTEVKILAFNETNSPLIFRNFLTISTSDKFEKEAYIDNGFYVSKISQMTQKNFLGPKGEENIYYSPYRKGSNFYIETSGRQTLVK